MTALARVPARRVVRAIADAAQRWCDADFPPRVRATDAVVARTGYALPVVEYALDRLFGALSEPALLAVLHDELGTPDTLDGFVPRNGRADMYAAPAGRVAVVSSRTTIGVALIPAAFALCAKCDVVVKDREDALCATFFETLAQEGPEFAVAATAQRWSHDETLTELSSFDVVVAFGNSTSLHDIREATRVEARFIPYGPRASAGYVTRETLEDHALLQHTVEGAARDLVLYESEGCLSLHALFVERGAVEPIEVGRRLAAAIERAAVEFPLGSRDAQRVADVATARNVAAFRAATRRGAVFSDDEARYLVVVDPPHEEPPLFLPRALAIHVVDGPHDALRYLREHHLPLEGFAVSSPRQDVDETAIAAGAARLAPFGQLQDPPITSEHGARRRVTDFVRFITRTA